MKSSNNFKEGLKGTTLLGGVQIYKILISVLRSKVLAIFLGPAGVGVLGLLNSTVDFIYGLTNFGLGTSAIRDISQADSEGDLYKLSFVSSVFKKLVWMTGFIGVAICVFLSPFWSFISFKNDNYTITIMILSIAVIAKLLSEGQNSLMQGTHNMRLMAKSNIWGNTLGLVITIPLYFYYGIEAVGPALVLAYLMMLCVSWYYSHKIKLIKIKVTFRDALLKGRDMARFGTLIALSGLLSVGVSYLVRIYVGRTGGLTDVGLYVAGFSMVTTYVDMIFTGMGTEYFPRLASKVNDKEAFHQAINEQMQISILLVAPLICIFLIFSKVAILILYTEDFLGIEEMLCFAILAILFKAPSWCCSYAILSKGDSKIFFGTEFALLAVMLPVNLFLYSLLGLKGLGIAYIVMYAYYLLQEWMVCKKCYGFGISQEVIMLYLPHLLLAVLCLITVSFFDGVSRYLWGLLFIFVDMIFSYRKLNEKIDVLSFIKSIIK